MQSTNNIADIVPPEIISPERRQKLKAYATTFMSYDKPYRKTEIMQQLYTDTLGDVERSKNGFALLVRAQIINSLNGEIYYHKKD